MKISYTKAALTEIDSIFSYIAQDNRTAALDVLKAIEKTAERLAMFPFSAVMTDVTDVRVTPVHPYPYLIFYGFYDDALVIRNVRHAARKRPAS